MNLKSRKKTHKRPTQKLSSKIFKGWIGTFVLFQVEVCSTVYRPLKFRQLMMRTINRPAKQVRQVFDSSKSNPSCVRLVSGFIKKKHSDLGVNRNLLQDTSCSDRPSFLEENCEQSYLFLSSLSEPSEVKRWADLITDDWAR